MVNRDDVQLFLERFTAAVKERGLWIIPRKKNIREEFLAGWLPYEVEEIICSLSPEDYVEGPVRNHDKSGGGIWVFAKKINRTLMYIELKLDREAKCLSFHPCEYRVVRPFAQGEN
jgi:hypothetical protein